MALQLNPALRDFWQTPARYRVLYGGRASSKSHDAAGVAIALAARYKIKFLCARQFQNKISESVYTLLKNKIETAGLLPLFKITNTSIKCKTTGSEFVFFGIARNLQEIKSLEGIDILWIEECAQMTKEQWETIEPTIRKEGSQIWLVFNPLLATDFVYKNFVIHPPVNSIVRKINFEENPFLSKTMLNVVRNHLTREPDSFDHVYRGEPIRDDDRAIIKMSFLQAAVDAHIKLGFEPTGRRVIGFDIADDGGDANATVETYGNVVTNLDTWKGLEDELLKSCSRVYARAVELGADVVFDCIGVGAGAGPKFDELNESRRAEGQKFQVTHYAFHAGSSPENPDDVYLELPHQSITNRDFFENSKAQAWTHVATRLRKTYESVALGVKHDQDELISISSEIPYLDQLLEELATPRKDVSGRGKMKVESKEDLKKRGIKSPNLADAFIDAFAPLQVNGPGFFDFF
jgi:phage terminase large subunit